MRGAIPPLPNTSSWRGAYLSAGTTFTFFTYYGLILYERNEASYLYLLCGIEVGWQ
jgi:hypothetical protein